MRLPDGTVLMHERAPYDPQKAHAYYLRTRKLKGRKRGDHTQATLTTTRKPSFTVTLSNGSKVNLTQEQLAEQKAYAAKRVGSIESRLRELNTRLVHLMAQAHQTKAKAKPESKADKAKTAKEYRQSHRQQLKNKAKAAPKTSAKATTTKPKTDPVADLQQKITQIKGSLSAAVEKQRSLLTATKNG